MENEILKVSHLYFDYPDTPVLRDVSFTLNRGEFLGIIGANGAGKSTLIKIILKLLPKAKGDIKIFGEDYLKFKDNFKIGYVPQKATSFNKTFPATVKEVVLSNLYSRKGMLKRYNKDDYKKLYEVLAAVGMDGYEDRLIGELSGGQQQRVFIARALISSPELLLMDEPTVGVDLVQYEKIMGIIEKLSSEGMTIIMTNHDTPRLIKAADKLLVFCEHGNGEVLMRDELTEARVTEILKGKRGHHHA